MCMLRTLHIEGLPPTMTATELSKLFCNVQYAEVSGAKHRLLVPIALSLMFFVWPDQRPGFLRSCVATRFGLRGQNCCGEAHAPDLLSIVDLAGCP